MSIIGIDFGNDSCLVTAAKAGFIETLTNDYSLRATPSYIAFDDRRRIIGVAAKNQQLTNMSNTVWGFKHLLGRKFNDPYVQRELTFIPIAAQPLSDGGIGIKVNYLGKETLFSPVQLAAMMLTKLKEITMSSLHSQVTDCVLTCPVFFTNAERKALLDACQIAGINVLRLMNETTATALHYGFYKTDLPEDKPRNVIFIDCGHSSLQASACAFTKGKLKILASTWDWIGGRDIDVALARHCANEFQERHNINVHSNPRAFLRLLTEVEKLKKQMSANNTRLPLAIECFINDIDLHTSLQRTHMEELCGSLFKRVEITFRKLLQESKLTLDDIHSVEVVGGSTRIPAIKRLIEEVFGQQARTTLNQDESVSSGATLQCAMMSPQKRVRDFGVIDAQNFAVKLKWDGECNAAGGELVVFNQYHAIPFSIALNFNRREPFSLTLEYAQEIPYPDPIIGKWLIKNVKPNEHAEPQEIRVKVRVNNHGIVLISRAHLIDKTQTNVEEMSAKKDEKSSAEQQQNTECQESQEKKTFKMIELPIEDKISGYTAAELHELIKQEIKMIAIDTREKERADARNALEEYVYDMREKLCDGGILESYLLKSDRDAFCFQIQELAVWLYEEGENCERDAYVEKLKRLRSETDIVKERACYFENCGKAMEDLKNCLTWAREIFSKTLKYEILTDMDNNRASEVYDKTQKWYETHFVNFTQSPRTANCSLKLNEILKQTQMLKSFVNDLLKQYQPQPSPQSSEFENGNKVNQTENAAERSGNVNVNENKVPKTNEVENAVLDLD